MTAKNITVNGKLYALVVTPPSVPLIVSPEPRFECIVSTCYKFGHSFSTRGAFGEDRADGTHVKGHFELNPSHSYASR